MKIHFLTFASSSFKKSLKRIQIEAERSGFFDTVTCMSESDLPISYRIRNFLILNRFTKGYGYWMWKSFVTKALLSKTDDGDMLFYADAGCALNKEGKKRFDEYIGMLAASEFSNLSFQMNHLEKEYTKGDVFKYFKVENNEDLKNTGMLAATVFLLQKDESSVNLINEWYSICHFKKKLIDDSESEYLNDPAFKAHRHDQSIFSLLRKINGSLILKDETFFNDWDEKKMFPIHTKRLR